jgi:hypothetical protein
MPDPSTPLAPAPIRCPAERHALKDRLSTVRGSSASMRTDPGRGCNCAARRPLSVACRARRSQSSLGPGSSYLRPRSRPKRRARHSEASGPSLGEAPMPGGVGSRDLIVRQARHRTSVSRTVLVVLETGVATGSGRERRGRSLGSSAAQDAEPPDVGGMDRERSCEKGAFVDALSSRRGRQWNANMPCKEVISAQNGDGGKVRRCVRRQTQAHRTDRM